MSLLSALPARVARQAHGMARHLELRVPRAAGEQLDLGPAQVPRRGVHFCEPRLGSEGFVHQTDGLEESGPVDRGHPVHAGDDVADRDIGGALGMLLPGNHLVGRRPLGAQRLVEPIEDRHDRGVLVAKPLEELHGERVGQGADAQLLQNVVPRRRLRAAQTQQLVRQLVGHGPRLAGADDQLRQAPQVLHQGHPEVDGDRPPLADGQRLNALVGADELLQRLQLEPAVAVRDVGPGQPVDPRVSREVALGDLGQQAVIALREVVANVPDLFVDDVEVVEQPLRGRRDRLSLPHRLGDVPVSSQENPRVVIDPGEEIQSFRGLLSRALGRGQALGVLLQPLHTEDLGTDRLLHVRRRHADVGGAHSQLSFRLCLTDRYLPQILLESQSRRRVANVESSPEP